MEHKRSEKGFAHLLALAGILIFAAIGISGWYVYEHHRSSLDSSSSSSKWVPNELSVMFKDGITYAQAVNLMKSYGLSTENANVAETDFTPRSYRGIKNEEANQVINKLRAYPEVKSVFDDSADPVNNRAGPDEKWIEVIWQENVIFDRIKQIQTATGYGLSNQPQGITRSLFVDAPTGQEDSVVKKLNHESIVNKASRVGKPVLQGGCDIEC